MTEDRIITNEMCMHGLGSPDICEECIEERKAIFKSLCPVVDIQKVKCKREYQKLLEDAKKKIDW